MCRNVQKHNYETEQGKMQLSSQPFNQGQPQPINIDNRRLDMFSNCIVHKELLIPAPGLTILVQPRPPKTFLTHRLIQRATYLKLIVHSLEETGQK